MRSANLFGTTPKVEHKKPVVEITFSNGAKWTPDTVLTKTISLKEYMKFLENGFRVMVSKPIRYKDTIITIDKKSSSYLISVEDVQFRVTKKDWKPFMETEIEKLYALGFIKIS